MNHQPQEHNSVPNFWSTRYAIGLFVIGGVAAYFLLTEHLAHVVGVLPFLLLLACPLMHIFMHEWAWTSPSSTEKSRHIR